MRKIIVLAIILFTAYSLYAFAQSPPATQPNPAEEIMKRIAQKEKENNIVKQKSISFKKIIATYDLKKTPAALKEHQTIFVHPEGEKSVEDIIEKNGAPLNKRAGSSWPPDVNQELVGRYDFYFDQPEIQLLDGQPVTVIKFKPKPKPNKSNITQTIVGALGGTIYVDIENFYIKKVEAKLTRKITWGWFLLIIYDLDLTFEQQLFNNITVVKSITGTAKARVSGFLRQEKHIYEYKDYSYIAPQPRQ